METWQGLDRRQQISLVALGVLMVAGLIAVGVWSTRPSWAVLYSELSPRDAQAVVERLREQGVSYSLDGGGTMVKVPRERLYELRIQLAGEGLPSGSTVGFELFDKTSFSTSDLQNDVNLQRALQGELERSISALQEIETARVHLALPEERLFSEQQEPPSGSVVVGLAGSRLGTEQVAAITQLVASAVPALESDAVTVVNTAGRVLTGGVEGAGGMQTLAQLEATRAWEQRVRSYLQSMLDSVLGRHRAVVRVQASLDFQSQQTVRETLEPADGEGVVKREEITEEQYEGTGNPEVGGPAGLDGREESATREGGRYEHRHETREYDYARLRENVSSPPGRLQRLAVAVVIDENVKGASPQQVQDLVAAAAGIDPTRGDQVTVEMMPIEAVNVAEKERELAEAAEAERARAKSISRAVRYGSVIAMLAMVGAGMVMVRRRLGPERASIDEEAADMAIDDDAMAGDEEPADDDDLEFSPMSVEELQAQTEGMEAEAEGSGEQPGQREHPESSPQRRVDRLSELGNTSPEDFARHLQGWLQQGPQAGADDDGAGGH